MEAGVTLQCTDTPAEEFSAKAFPSKTLLKSLDIVRGEKPSPPLKSRPSLVYVFFQGLLLVTYFQYIIHFMLILFRFLSFRVPVL